MNGEVATTFECFGGRCAVRASHPDRALATEAVREARRRLLDAHLTLSRFDPESELSRLNRDRRAEVPASPLMLRMVAAALEAGLRSGGLVDVTLVDAIEAAGYADSRDLRPTSRPARRLPHPTPDATPRPARRRAGVSSRFTTGPGRCRGHRGCGSTSAASPRV